jgi:bis(5'-adenosyl)-triphosphatase
MEKLCPFCGDQAAESSFALEGGILAIYNISPLLPGHSLIVPEHHAGSLFDLSEDEISRFFAFARKVTHFLMQVYNAEAFDWSLQEGEIAGQSVEHLHLHIIPRTSGDLPEGVEWYSLLYGQQSQGLDNPERVRLNTWEHAGATLQLRQKWEEYNKVIPG